MNDLKILFVEDESQQRKVITQKLKRKGFSVIEAASGIEALQLFDQDSVDVVLCDLNMPQMDGLQVLAEIRKKDENLPVIIITAHGSIQKAVEAIKQGAQNFVLKPLEINQIVPLINQAVENYQLQKRIKMSENLLTLLVENVPDVVYSLDTHGHFISLNPSVENALGYKQEELLGKSVFNVIHEKDRNKVLQGFRKSIRQKEKGVRNIEFRMISKAGEVKDFEISRKLYFEKNKVVRSDGIARDITERKRLERELKEYSEELEKRVEERTEKLEYAKGQLEALNIVSNKFAQIFDENILLREIPKLLTESLDFDRVALYFKEDGKLVLKSHNLDKVSYQICQKFLENLNRNPDSPPPYLADCLNNCKTILISDISEIGELSDEIMHKLKIRSLVVSPIRVKGQIIGFIEGDMIAHKREMDKQDVSRFEMFANMVGLAIDNIRSYQNLEKIVDERTKSLNESNRQLRTKAKELEKSSFDLGKANLKLFKLHEEMTEKNTQMKRLLDEISQNEKVLQSTLDSAFNVLIMVDNSGKVIATNRMTKDFFGIDPEEILNKSFKAFLNSVKDTFEDSKRFLKLISQLQQQPVFFKDQEFDVQKFYNRAIKLLPPQNRFLLIFTKPVLAKEGKQLGRLWSFVDITPMKKVDEILHAIVEVSPIPFIITKVEDGEVLYANKPLADLVGVDPEKVIGLKTPDFYANPQDRGIVLEKIKVDGYVKDYEVQIRRRDGRVIWMIMSLMMGEIEGGPVVIGALYDINERRIAEEALRKERNFISAILETLGALVIVLNPQGNIIRFNRACEQLTGWTFDEVKGRRFWDFLIPANEVKAVQQVFNDLKSGNFPNNFENYWITKDGKQRLVAWSNTALVDDNGEVEFVIGTGIDITERKIAEEKLRLYREIYLNSHDGIGIFDSDGYFVEQNPKHQESLGYSDRYLEGKSILDLIGKEKAIPIIQSLKKKGSYRGEMSLVSKDRRKADIDLSIFSIFNKDQKLECYVGIARDISERKQAEVALQKAHDQLEKRVAERTKELAELNRTLREEIEERKQTEKALLASEANNRALLEAIPDLMFRLSAEGVYLDYQAPKQSDLEIPKEEVVGKTIFETLPPGLAEKTKEILKKVLRTKKIQILEYQLPHGDLLKDFEARVVFTGKNEVLSIVRDITEQKRAKEALQKAHDELEKRVSERTAELANTNEILREEISERLQAERTLESRLRYEEGLAACSRALLQFDDMKTALTSALKELREAVDADRVYICENFEDEKDGLYARLVSEVCAEGIKSQMDNKALHHMLYKDQSQRWRKKLERGEHIAGSVKRFPKREKEILEAQGILSVLILPIFTEEEWFGIIGFDDVLPEEKVWGEEDIRLLRTASEIIGGYISKKKAEEALGVSEERFRSLVENAHDIIYSTDPAGKFSYLSPQFKEFTGYHENEFIGKTLEPLMHPEDLVKSGEKWKDTEDKESSLIDYDIRIKHKDGTWRWFTTHSTQIKNDDGDVVETVGIAHDVTEMKEIMESLGLKNKELRETQSQLVQSEKMASLGMLVAGIAHEINTPVGAIGSMHDTLVRAVDKLKNDFLDKYGEIYQKDKRIKATIDIVEDANKVIKSATERVTNIVRRLRSFARLDEAALKDANIHEGLEDTLTIVHHEIKHNIKVNKNYGQVPIISCYPSRLNQVFLNLLINAKQAIKEKGEITITTYMKNNKVYVEISDTGAGIPKENLNKIFDPGYTTKGVGVGTGLGLSIVYQIIQEHQGDIMVDSDLGKGTKFTVILPADLEERLEHT